MHIHDLPLDEIANNPGSTYRRHARSGTPDCRLGAIRRARAYKTELDPNNAQREWFRRCAGIARFCYNWGLAAMQQAHVQGRKTSVLAEKKRLNSIKGEQYPWLYEVPYTVLEAAFDNLRAAYENFFRRMKQGGKPGFPRFKSRQRSIPSFTVRGNLKVESGRIRIPVPKGVPPQYGWVRLKERGYLPIEGAKLLSFTISERAGRWFVSAQVEEDVPEPDPATGPPIGVDFGVSNLAVCSDGTVFANVRALAMAERRIKRLSRELARRKKGGRNREKTRWKLAKAHYRVACIRRHVLHQISHYVTAKTKPCVVVLEDLNVKGMQQNRHLAKAIADASFAELRRQIEYKGDWYGVDVLFADRWYASSKTCSECGAHWPDLTLADRTVVCPECGVTLDRDLNAALNLVSLAQ